MITAQGKDSELRKLFSEVVPTGEVDEVRVCFFVWNGPLLRKWRSSMARADDSLAVKTQIVASQSLGAFILELAHENSLSGHLGTRKMRDRILEHFWWPGITFSITGYVRTCHASQKVGKSNQRPSKYPLKPIPVMEEPFTELLVDEVGPLPKHPENTSIYSPLFALVPVF